MAWRDEVGVRKLRKVALSDRWDCAINELHGAAHAFQYCGNHLILREAARDSATIYTNLTPTHPRRGFFELANGHCRARRRR
jgi:hypothetical protein